jgi:hypothetical protein
MRRADPQPVSVEIKLTDDLFIKTASVAKQGTLIPTHAHAYDHVTLLAVGSMAVYADDEWLGDYHGPVGILIRAHVKHALVTLTDGVVFACIHALHGTEGVEIEEEHIVPAVED